MGTQEIEVLKRDNVELKRLLRHVKSQMHDLSGVINDVKEGAGFDDTCLETVARVRDVLARLPGPSIIPEAPADNNAEDESIPEPVAVGRSASNQPKAALTPNWAGEFKSFEDWLNRAEEALRSPEYRRAVCVDTIGRRCAIGKDFIRARDEKTYPVRYFWDCQPRDAGANTAE
jgi:hypothetical protein